MKRLWWNILIYSVLFVVVFYMLHRDYSPILIVAVSVMAGLIAFTNQFYYPAVLDKRVERVEDFLLSQKHKPAVYIHYVLANRLDDEAKSTMDRLMRKYRNSKVLATYKAAYGLYCKDMAAIGEAVPFIGPSDYRAYYATVLLIEDGKSAEAREHLQSIKKRWMRSALLAGIEHKAGNSEAAVNHARDAVNASGGAQRYLLHKEYERTLPQAVERVS